MPGDRVLGITCDENASATEGCCPPNPLPELRPQPNAFLIVKQLYCALHPGLVFNRPFKTLKV